MPAASPRTTHNLSVRLPEDLFNQLALLAKIQDRTLGEVVRQAIRDYWAEHRNDTEIVEKVAELRKEMDKWFSA